MAVVSIHELLRSRVLGNRLLKLAILNVNEAQALPKTRVSDRCVSDAFASEKYRRFAHCVRMRAASIILITTVLCLWFGEGKGIYRGQGCGARPSSARRGQRRTDGQGLLQVAPQEPRGRVRMRTD